MRTAISVRGPDCTSRDAGGGGKVLREEVKTAYRGRQHCQQSWLQQRGRGDGHFLCILPSLYAQSSHRDLNTSAQVLITPLSSRSTHIALHFPSSQSTSATTRAGTVLFAFTPPRCVASLKSRPHTTIFANSESKAVPAM
ncbi:hypothetical protein FIBSPDRAFT_964102 [Athelia psychrophila]|uniref:Uncharacterized protein n=1 Tax=Athelia psychrophila TaxID=1759441 RepID=A0A165Y6T3_9AGAM|nr:hypothetical protein FIBSPDRAFT_964102 [Fibularhizoctonia sp. CBS 109695]